jgi:sterol desaturase/sphingolipid hydroxylase (fatty acid hydroxylase superfamily)
MHRSLVLFRVAYAPAFFAGFIGAALLLWQSAPRPALLGLLLVLAIAISLLAERIAPYRRAFNKGRGDRRRDVCHALVNEVCNIALLSMFPLFATWVPASGLWPTGWPQWTQLALAILVADMAITMVHFLSHRHAVLWRFHAVHHSVERLYGLNGLMKHPVHQAIELTAAAVPLLLLNMPPAVAWLLAFAVAIQLLLQHGNVDMRVGPLARVWAVAPVHRFHHVNTPGQGDVNFGLFTTLWDRLLGTCKADPARSFAPGDFGIAGEPDYPSGYLAQLRQPWRRR